MIGVVALLFFGIPFIYCIGCIIIASNENL